MKLRNIIFALLALITILYFIPKTNLYYQLEHTLEPHGIIVHNEHVDDRRFWMEVLGGELYVKKIETLHVKKARIMLFGAYNRIDFSGITLASTAGQFVPAKIETATLRHALYDPFHLHGEINGEFGTAEVTVDLSKRLFKAEITASALMKSKFKKTLSNLVRDKKGVYHYEYRF